MLPVHYDMNLLTLQLPSDSPGLELLDIAAASSGATEGTQSSGWVDVEALPQAPAFDLVVFGGAPLHRLSAGFYPACSHRVVAAADQETRVSTVFKLKVAPGARLQTQAVVDAACAAGRDLADWLAPAAAVLRPSAGAGHPFLSLEPETGCAIADMELGQLEVAAALHNLAELRPEIAPQHSAPAPNADAAAGGPREFVLRREPGEKFGASVAADTTLLKYTSERGAAARAGLPLGWKVVKVDGAETQESLAKLKQLLQSPSPTLTLTCLRTQRVQLNA